MEQTFKFKSWSDVGRQFTGMIIYFVRQAQAKRLCPSVEWLHPTEHLPHPPPPLHQVRPASRSRGWVARRVARARWRGRDGRISVRDLPLRVRASASSSAASVARSPTASPRPPPTAPCCTAEILETHR